MDEGRKKGGTVIIAGTTGYTGTLAHSSAFRGVSGNIMPSRATPVPYTWNAFGGATLL